MGFLTEEAAVFVFINDDESLFESRGCRIGRVTVPFIISSFPENLPKVFIFYVGSAWSERPHSLTG